MKICVKVLSASNVPSPKTLDTIDTYVLLKMSTNKNYYKTRIIDNSQNPAWKQIIDIPVDYTTEYDTLSFQLMNINVLEDIDQEIGKCQIETGKIEKYEIIKRSMIVECSPPCDCKLNVKIQIAHLNQKPFERRKQKFFGFGEVYPKLVDESRPTKIDQNSFAYEGMVADQINQNIMNHFEENQNSVLFDSDATYDDEEEERKEENEENEKI